jgi:ubiquinone/menaquinone biosynthesis C-methylase UbiE
MADLPDFRKPDRYKASSYRSYNFKMPACYDTAIWSRGAPQIDQMILEQLGPAIGSLQILDVGCGTGRLLKCLADAGATNLFGADLAPRILEVAAAKLAKVRLNAELRVADAEDCLPWDDECFDVVTLIGVIHHFFRPKDALSEIRRVLRHGGRLLVFDACFFPAVRQIVNAVLRIVPHDGDCRFYSVKAAGRLLAVLGFEIGKVQKGWGCYLVEGVKSKAQFCN